MLPAGALLGGLCVSIPIKCVEMCGLAPPGYDFYGLNRGEHEGKKGIWYREWAPGAQVGRCGCVLL